MGSRKRCVTEAIRQIALRENVPTDEICCEIERAAIKPFPCSL